MKFLRTASIRRLLATITGAVLAIAGGAAIAVAATSGGPVPQPSSLADAVHQGLAAPKLTGISADISFTDSLIGSSELQGSDPILDGASGRLWLSPSTDQLRLELQSDNGDAEVVVSKGSFWISDPGMNMVYEGTLPAEAQKQSTSDQSGVPSLDRITTELGQLAQHLNFNGASAAPYDATPGDVAGRPTYSVTVSPKQSGGLLGAVKLAWDVTHGVPLDLAVYASGDAAPVLELKATHISYGPVPASDFAITPPAGEQVVKISAPADAPAGHGGDTPVTGLADVAASLPFTLAAPATAAGLPRRTVAKLGWGGKAGALVTYGDGLGGVAVFEYPAPTTSSGGGGQGDSPLSLPTVSIDGISAEELATALGTGLTFTKGGVTYVVLGSVSGATAKVVADAVSQAS
jgi:hypothetical protein